MARQTVGEVTRTGLGVGLGRAGLSRTGLGVEGDDTVRVVGSESSDQEDSTSIVGYKWCVARRR